MNIPTNNLRRPATSLGIALMCALNWGAASAATAPLSVCLADDSLPFSASQPQPSGLDYDIAVEMARRTNRALQLSWVQIPNRGGLPKALGQSFEAGSCAVFMGVPRSAEADEPEARLRISAPYRSARYVLVAARHSKLRTRADAQRARRIAAVTATPADLYLFRTGYSRVPYGSNAALLEALSSDEVDAALIWWPALARLTDNGRALWPEAIRLDAIDDAELRTEFSYAMPSSAAGAGAELDALLGDMRSDGTLQNIAQQYGLVEAP
jgi:ABC-type amino acid transport substrate-binding protein